MEKEPPTEIVRSVNTVEVLDKIQEQLTGFNREPFRKELSRFLCFAPTDKALQDHANKSPDRWSQGIAILSKLSGITDKVEDTSQLESIQLFQNLSMMDKRKKLAELESQIKDGLRQELEAKGAILDPDTLDTVTLLELDDGNGETERPGNTFEAPDYKREDSVGIGRDWGVS